MYGSGGHWHALRGRCHGISEVVELRLHLEQLLAQLRLTLFRSLRCSSRCCWRNRRRDSDTTRIGAIRIWNANLSNRSLWCRSERVLHDYGRRLQGQHKNKMESFLSRCSHVRCHRCDSKCGELTCVHVCMLSSVLQWKKHQSRKLEQLERRKKNGT